MKNARGGPGGTDFRRDASTTYVDVRAKWCPLTRKGFFGVRPHLRPYTTLE